MTIKSGTATHLRVNKIACIGEVMIELVADGDKAELNVAGDTYNTAVYLARLLRESTANVSYVTAIGTDSFSTRILDHAHAHGINTDFISRHPQKMPGLYAIETDEAGERSFTYWRSDSAARTLFGSSSDVGLDMLDAFDLVFLSGISLAILPEPARQALIEWLMSFRLRGGIIAYDSNHRPMLWEGPETAQRVNARMWSICDIALPTIDDEMMIFGEASELETFERLKAVGVSDGALKRGDKGPCLFSGTGSAGSFASVAKVVDSTAAGDSFNAGFLADWVFGKASEVAIQSGHNLASQVIQKRGAIVETCG